VSTSSTVAALLPADKSENADGLIVKKSIGSYDLTLVSALPAYVGLTNVLLSYINQCITIISTISPIG
jgi:hypothetical protein